MISIVIPTREEEADIGRMVRQFAPLSFPHEVIVSDCGSQDKTVEIARSAGASVVVNTSTVRSPAKQRNDGARASRGEFIMFVDTTVRFPDINVFVKNVIAAFERDPHLVGMSFEQWIYSENATLADRLCLMLINWYTRLTDVGSGKCMLCRRAAYEQIGGLREELMTGEDRDFMERLKSVGVVRCNKDVYIEYSGRREHAWGWTKLLYVWLRDTLWIVLFDRSRSKDWAPVR